jgi:hypothetical protein
VSVSIYHLSVRKIEFEEKKEKERKKATQILTHYKQVKIK